MSIVHGQRLGQLEINQDFEFQRREWRFQFIGWLLMSLPIVAALLGLMGSGPLSDATATAPDSSLQVEYHRFLHRHNPGQITLHLRQSPPQKARIWISHSLLHGMKLEETTPRAETVEAGASGDYLTFLTDGTGGPMTIKLYIDPEAIGWLSASAKLDGEPAVEFGQFIYP